MENPSRRAFLGGKVPELSPWDQFLLQLHRKVQGTVHPLEAESSQALLTVAVIADLHHARQLCHAFGVKLYVLGMPYCADDLVNPVLWVDVSQLNQLLLVDKEKNQWFMQAGVTMAQLKAAGFSQLADLPDTLNVACWLAQPQYHPYAPQQVQKSGLVHASLLMADGTVGSLGAFGTQNTKPLNTPTLRQLVPQLFQLSQSEAMQQLLRLPAWGAQYRLDALVTEPVNLAYLLLGHGGHLGVLEWVVIQQSELRVPPPLKSPPLSATLQILAQELDAAVRAAFDPDALFSY